jgi:hypothetical protein
MIRYRFGQDDLLRTRFAIAPLMELVGAVYVRRDPDRFFMHRPWVEWARPRTQQLDLSLLDIAAPFGTPFWPVFIGPPPGAAHDRRRRAGACPRDATRASRRRDNAHLSERRPPTRPAVCR